MTRLLLVTNVWNEEARIPELVKFIDAQTLKPVLWFWIDDGSSNGSYNEIIKAKTTIPIQVLQVEPAKNMGELDTIGHAYSQAHSYIKNLDFDYLGIADVDNKLEPDYFEIMCRYMDQNPDVGTLSAQALHDPIKRKPDNPMGGGKIVRWSVIQSFDTYWDLAPDTFLNIKAQAIGLRSVALQDYYIDAPPANIFTSKGRFRFGRRMYYVRRHILLLLFQAVRFKLRGDHANEYLRGYWFEWAKGSWKCEDPDIREFYSAKAKVRRCFK